MILSPKHLTLATVLALAPALPVMADTPISTAKATIGKDPAATLLPIQKRIFTDFRSERSHFGAYARNIAEDTSYWVRNFSDLGKARAAALKGCDVLSTSGVKGKCTIYAVMVPKGMDVSTTNARQLGREAAQVFTGSYRSKQVEGRYGAFASSPSSAYGTSWNWPNAAEARATALAYCEANALIDLASLNIEGRTWAKRNGLATCDIVDVFGP
jgi:hypothetical protein